MVVSGGSLFKGLPETFVAGRYHSLYAPADQVRGGFSVTATLCSPEGADGVVMAIEDAEAAGIPLHLIEEQHPLAHLGEGRGCVND